VRWGDLTPEEGQRSLDLARGLAVHLVPPDDEQARRAYEWTLRLKRTAAYDGFYLALAESLGCELWTMDERLHNAVGLPWVRLAGT
jgi:predicted nucleic acid-binding protein